MSDSASRPWNETFLELFDACCSKYRGGNEDYSTYYDDSALAFLKAIGHKPREFFDFVEDFCDGCDISPSTALLVAAARRDYFLTVQKGAASDHEIRPEDLPAKDSEQHGMRWFPRILAKARAKLRGELDPNMMYCCGGDRAFLARQNLHPADFLRVVWAAGDDDSRVAAFAKSGRWD